jgi:hypothetical protein
MSCIAQFVDAEDPDCSSWCRFINHDPDPNLALKVLPKGIGGKPRVWFVAMRPIPEGQELCFDYGPDYWCEADGVETKHHVPLRTELRFPDEDDPQQQEQPPQFVPNAQEDEAEAFMAMETLLRDDLDAAFAAVESSLLNDLNRQMPTAPVSAETSEQEAKRRWLEENSKKTDALRGAPTPSMPARSAPTAAPSAYVFDDLSDAQLMHLCINGNEQDARCAEGEIDRRMGDNHIQLGQSLTMEGAQVLTAAGMSP